jgi:hypothetical protein
MMMMMMFVFDLAFTKSNHNAQVYYRHLWFKEGYGSSLGTCGNIKTNIYTTMENNPFDRNDVT